MKVKYCLWLKPVHNTINNIMQDQSSHHEISNKQNAQLNTQFHGEYRVNIRALWLLTTWEHSTKGFHHPVLELKIQIIVSSRFCECLNGSDIMENPRGNSPLHSTLYETTNRWTSKIAKQNREQTFASPVSSAQQSEREEACHMIVSYLKLQPANHKRGKESWFVVRIRWSKESRIHQR